MSDDFFAVSDGKLPEAGQTYVAPGGDFETIPANTEVTAAIVEVKNDEFFTNYGSEDKHLGINIKWQFMSPEAYKGRVIFQKIHTGHPDTKKRDNAIRMLVAIDNLAGGKLRAKGGAPNDIDLMKSLAAKQMNLKLRVWKNGDKTGNWVGEVGPKAKPQEVAVQDDDLDL